MKLSKILIAEDGAFSRAMLEKQLTQMGYEAVSATDGQEAWEILKVEPINMVITDWLMPKLSGIDLCRKIRSAALDRYIYTILLTAKKDKSELVEGMEAGADDFIVKPFHPAELKVRVRAGERVLKYENTLISRNQELHKTNQELHRASEVIRENLKLAGNFQKALLPEESTGLRGLQFESFFIPSEYVAGDIYNFFPFREDQVAFYLLDVAGHGIPAAMLSFTLSHMITPPAYRSLNFTERRNDPGFLDFGNPRKLAENLNQRFQVRSDDQQYFTMIYGLIDLKNNRVSFTQAGHPPLIHLPANGEARALGEGGFPMGIFPDIDVDIYEFELQPNDRMFLYSDGVTECLDSEKKPYSTHRLMEIINHTRNKPLSSALQHIRTDLKQWRQSEEFADDLSLLAIEFDKPQT